MPDSENIIKGRIAKTLVEELLKASGRRVYNLGTDIVLENIIQHEDEFDKDKGLGAKIAMIPDYIVFGPKRPVFIEVKFRSDPGSLEEELLLAREVREKYWKVKIVVVTLKEKPYFRVLVPPYFSNEKRDGWPVPVVRWRSLEKDKDFAVDPAQLERFEKLAEKYFGFKN
jgi:hypothetical protein